MTLPDERYRALLQMRERLVRLCTAPGKIQKQALRREVLALLRHYPSQSELERIAEKAPELLKVTK